VGDDRAETYLRLLAETELRRVPRLLGQAERRPDGRSDPAGELLPDGGLLPDAAFRPRSDIARSAAQLSWVGDVLVAAGVLAPDRVSRIEAELDAALTARARSESAGRVRRLNLALERIGAQRPEAPPEPHGAAQPTQVTPIGRTLRVAGERAPSELHLMALVRTEASAAVTVAMRMNWPADGSSADLEITGAGPQHLPYDQLWAVDDQGTRYRLQLVGEGGTATWQGIADLSPTPPPGARWLDLIADERCRLIRLDLTRPMAPAPALNSATERPQAAPGERVLAGQAERILASAGEAGGASADPHLGEIIAILAAAGAIAPDSATPGHLAALCQRLGARGHGIAAVADADLPASWASVLAGLDPGSAEPGPEWYAPLGVVLADTDGARFAVGGLTSAAGQTHLHVVATGVPLPSGGWDPGFSWWVRDDHANWHVGTQSYRHRRDCGQVAFRVRLIPPLSARPDTIEVAVTGPATRVGALVPVREAPGCRTLDT
jgi:hypothetical protein